MNNKSNSPSHALIARTARFEAVEERIVLSAQPLAGLVQHVELVTDVEQPIAVEGDLVHHLETGLDDSGAPGVTPHLNGAHAATGVSDVRADYGFTGSGQTVVVIDSGIAYDHVALGGGFGPGNRVVGGWDFAENDADPFDDAPAGFHGTHVAGIIGSGDATYSGVAPEVDLVALRVFDDFGNGDFAWVEDALQWVLANVDTFANPITTVNMSLGAPEENYGDVPWWAMLEDEMQALYNEGIFVSVSAGNDFELFNSQGLSYPAVSPWVVPVASANDAGTTMSSFSQRDDHVLVAPGESIISSVPDELFSFDGVPNDWAYASGTSMASPYVAGASVLLRQAYDFMGVESVDQGMIYDALFDTSKLIYDPITAASYHFIDVEAAMASIITDAYGDTSGAASNVGSLGDGDSFGEWIGKLSDRDYFTFTAAQSGTMTLAADVDHQMAAQWELIGGGGSVNGNELSFDVVAGQTYTVGLMSSDGMGHYTVSAALQSNVVDWGVVERTHVDDVVVDGETWYGITTTRAGLVTVEASYAGNENVNIEIYNDQGQLLSDCTQTSGHARSDTQAGAGETLLVRVTGSAAAADFSMWNIVGISGSTATVLGTSGDDAFTFAAGGNHAVSVNGLAYTLDGAITNVNFAGGAGVDQIAMTGSTGADTAVLRVGNAQLTGSGYAVLATDMKVVNVDAGGGSDDQAYLYDGTGDDALVANPTQVQFSGTDFSYTASGFDKVKAYATAGGFDTAQLDGSNGNDLFIAKTAYAYMSGDDYYNLTKGFDQVAAFAGGGSSDRAYLYDGAGDDVLIAGPTQAQLSGTDFSFTAHEFDKVKAYATEGGFDTAQLNGSHGVDEFVGRSTYATMSGDNYDHYAEGFDEVLANAAGGTSDVAYLYGSAGNDVLIAGPTQTQFSGADYNYIASGFNKVKAYAKTGGFDTAQLDGSSGNDLYIGRTAYGYMSGAGYFNVVKGFAQVSANAGGGSSDRANLYGNAGNDALVAGPTQTQFSGADYNYIANGFDKIKVYAKAGGFDTAHFDGSNGNDLFIARTTYAYMSGDDYYNIAKGFHQISANAADGSADRAHLYDGAGDDTLIAGPTQAQLIGTGINFTATGFDKVKAYATGGNDIAQYFGGVGGDDLTIDSFTHLWEHESGKTYAHDFEESQVDFTQGGNDSVTINDVTEDELLWGNGASVSLSGDRVVDIEGLDELTAVSAAGQTADAEINAVDYLFSLLGDWD